MTYDDADRALRINETWGGGRDTAYTYDPRGQIDSRKVDGKILPGGGFDGGRTTRFAFDELGREEKMTVVVADAADRVTNTTYWPSGQTRQRDKAAGATDRTYFDSAGRLSRMVRNNQAGGEVKDQSYSYDENANRSRDERGSHEFNARDQLTQWTRATGRPDPGSTVSYELNASGAILNKTDTATSPQLTTYEYNENPAAGTRYIGDRLIRTIQGTQTTNYDYNALGDITKIDVPSGTDTTYSYDDFERRQATTGPDGSESYTYDALDRREKTTKSGNTFDHSYIGLTEQLSREQPQAGSGGESRTFDYDSALQRQGQWTSTGYRSFALDANGSVEGLESPTGELASDDTYVYDPYGELEGTALSTEAGASPFRFQGHYSDSAVNTYDMQARSYRPDIGRFLSPDRYEAASGDVALQSDPLTNNRYAFLGGNPVSNVESDGHEPEGSFKNGCDNTYGSDARCAKESKSRQRASAKAPDHVFSSNWRRGGRDVRRAAADKVNARGQKREMLLSGLRANPELAKGIAQADDRALIPARKILSHGFYDEPIDGSVWPDLTLPIGGVVSKAASKGTEAAGWVGRTLFGIAGRDAARQTQARITAAVTKMFAGKIGSRGASGVATKGAPRGVRRACNCFPAGTRVKTNRGSKPIERVRIGDRVWARDLKTGKPRLRRVTGLFSKRAQRLLTITVGTSKFEVTPEHPMWVAGRGWVDSGHLREGDHLARFDGREVEVASIRHRSAAVTVYNFEVEGDRNYFISDEQLLVHNCDLTALSRSGQDPIAPGSELSRAGNALQKHQGQSSPLGGSFPAVRGGDRAKSQMGQDVLDDILTAPGTRTAPITGGNFKGGTAYITRDGRGAAFDSGGTFQYFGVYK